MFDIKKFKKQTFHDIIKKQGDIMDYKVLYRKYRPDSFQKIVGQDYIVNILKNAIINNKLAHAYIFKI